MSWNGTVRCGNCYEKGHNKRSCPSLRERMEKRLAADPDDYYAKSYFKKKEGSKKRTCSYCKGSGHNRRTCPNLKKAVSEWTRCNKAFRAQVLALLRDQGVGPGTLVELPEIYMGGHYAKNQIGVVTGFKWGVVNVDSFRTTSPVALTVSLVGQYAGKTINYGIPHPDENELGWTQRNQKRLQVVSPTSASYIEPPDGWASGEVPKLKVKELFSDDTWGSQYMYHTTGSRWVENTSVVMESALQWEEHADAVEIE